MKPATSNATIREVLEDIMVGMKPGKETTNYIKILQNHIITTLKVKAQWAKALPCLPFMQ